MAERKERVLPTISEEAEQTTPLLKGTVSTNNGVIGEAPTYGIQFKPSNSSHKRHSKKCRAIICLVLIIFLILFLTCTSLSIYYSLLSTMKGFHEEFLGIASDVIQCARHVQWNLISTVTIKENNSDYLNDNPKGIPLDVFSLHSNDIIYHYYEDPHTDFELVLPRTGDNKFIIPYNYYNRPWYMWPGSTINITLNINSSDPPKEALAYLIKGDNAVNKFFENKEKISQFEKRVDLVTLESNNIFWIVKGNDYYYVAFYIYADEDTIFKANISFVFKYIDTDDYSWLSSSDKHLKKIGDSVKFNWFKNDNITLCYLHPLDPSSLESDSIHVETSYAVDKTLITTVAVCSNIIFIPIIALIMTCCALFLRQFNKNYKHVT